MSKIISTLWKMYAAEQRKHARAGAASEARGMTAHAEATATMTHRIISLKRSVSAILLREKRSMSREQSVIPASITPEFVAPPSVPKPLFTAIV